MSSWDTILENKRPTTSQMFGEAFGNLGQAAGQAIPQYYREKQQQQQTQQENEAYKRLTGHDLTGLSPEARQKAFGELMQGQNQTQLQNLKFGHEAELQKQKYGYESELQNEKNLISNYENELKNDEERKSKLAPYQAGLKTIAEMRRLGKKGNLGRGSSIKGVFGGETAKDLGKYRQLGKSLIQLAAPLKITNRTEFEEYAKDLSNPFLSDSEREGILEAVESIIRNSMEEHQPNENKILDITTMEQLYQEAGGNKEEIKRLAKERGYKI